MATIRSVFSPGQTFNVLDPNAWVGGVVPGPSDIAQIGENGDYRDTINMGRAPYSSYASPFSGSTIVKNSGSVIYPWEGDDVIIPVNSVNTNFNNEYQFPDTSGSFIIHSRGNFPANIHIPIKIDYLSKGNSYYFYSCSIDRSYSNWIYKTGSNQLYDADFDEKGYPKEISTLVRNGDYVYPLHTKFELTGSDTWHVGQIETLERCHLTIKDNATLKLDGSSVNPNAIYNNQDSYRNEIRILDNVTVELTGSTQRTNAGIYFYNRSGMIQISGSDLCPSTTLAQSANAGDSIIKLTNTSSIGEGSIISIDNTTEHVEYRGDYFSVGDGSVNPYGRWSNVKFPTGSSFRSTGAANRGGLNTFISGNFEEHEVAQVISQSGNDYTVAKLFGKEGKIQEDLGTYTYEEFTQNFSGSLAIPYSGSKRVVLIDSLHKDFQVGEKLIISRSVVAEVLYADYYLSSSLFLDFENGATTDSIHTSSYAGYTGSFIDVTTDGQYNLYYEDYFRGSQHWSTAERNGTSSLHVGNFSQFYSPSNPRNYSAFVLKNTNFHEGEITVVWDRNRHLSGSADTSTYLTMACGIGHKHDGVLPAYNSWKTYDIGWYFRFDRQYFQAGGRQNDGGNAVNINFQPFYGDSYGRIGNKSPRYTAKATLKKGHSQTYLDGTKVADQLEIFPRREPIKFITYRYANIFSIDVKEYYQLVLLDTEESFNYKDSVLEGARLEYNQTAGKRVRTNANKIKNPLGYYNLLNDQLENGKEATIRPYPHSQTTSRAQNGNYNSLYRWGSQYVDGALHYNLIVPRVYQADNRKTGTGYYIIYDLQTETSMSALSFRDYYDYNYDYTERAGENIQIDVSNDLENWTTVYGPTPDPRYTTRLGQLRFYDFTSGSISGRFVKLYLNGSSRNSGNAYSSIGLYNFYDENNQDMGNTIELYNADMFEVGDKIFFQEFKYPQGIEQRDQRFPAVEWDTLPGVTAGTTTDDDVCGGLTFLHTITAKDGNKITVDRKIANYPIYKDTHVYKWNQGGINFKGNHKNLAVWYNRRMMGDSYSMYQCVNANFDHCKTFTGIDGGGSDNPVLNSLSENVSVNGIDKDTGVGFGAIVEKNNLIAGAGRGAGFGSNYINQNDTPDTYDALIFNNVSLNYSYYTQGVYPKYYGVYNNYVYTYNLYGPKFVYTQMSGMSNFKFSSVIPKLKWCHNFITYNRLTTATGTWGGQLDGAQSFIDHVEMRDNYSHFARTGGYTVDNLYPQYRLAQNNIHSDKVKDFILYGYHVNTQIDYSNFSIGSRFGNTAGYIPYLTLGNDSLLGTPILGIGPMQSSPPFRIIKPKENTYRVYKGQNVSLGQSRLWYGAPYIYYAKIKVLETQDVKFYTKFDYQRDNLWQYVGTQTNTNQIRQGYYYEELYQPRIILAKADNKEIIDKVDLSSYGNDTALYNKTHTLEPGEYLYFLTAEDVGLGVKIFEHGPVNFNIFSTSPSTIKLYHNTWGAHTLLDGDRIQPIEVDVASNKGRFKALRASNTLPTGTIKIRTLKL